LRVSCHVTAKDERRFALYAQGLIDREIGDAVGVTNWAICDWRRRRNLPPNDSLTIRFSYANAAKKALKQERIRLILRGWTDQAIAYHQDRDRKSIYNFRKREGLPLATGTVARQTG
jgi:hypothetical protein